MFWKVNLFIFLVVLVIGAICGIVSVIFDNDGVDDFIIIISKVLGSILGIEGFMFVVYGLIKIFKCFFME